MRHPRNAAAGRGPDLLSAPPLPEDGPAVSVATHIIKSGAVDAFKDWADRFDRAAAGQPGFLDTLRLEQTGGVIHLIQRFATAQQLNDWHATAAFRSLAAEADRTTNSREQTGHGRDIRISLPGEADAAKWKKFLMTLVAVFPVLLALNLLVGLTGLPQLARLAITSPLLTAVLTWVILPKVTRWLKPWVLTDAQGRPHKPGE